MKTLIIAEKSNLAKSIVDALKLMGENPQLQNNNKMIYHESDNYVICAARGHLYTLFDVDDYLGVKSPWTMEQLPFFPTKFKFKAIPGTESHIKTISHLLKRNDINVIVNAGDSAREGEFLIRLILQELGNAKPVKRLWMPSQVPADIKDSLLNMKDDSYYDGLFNEGLARCIDDWLSGINYTRYASLRSGNFLRVGRVLSVVVRVIYERDLEIANFKSEKYYTVDSEVDYLGVKLKMSSEYEFDADEKEVANKMAKVLNSQKAVVKNIETKKRKVGKPKLFSLAKLQNYMSNQYSFAPDKTDDIAQKLYEAAFISYPRTDTEYLEEGMKDKVKRIIGRLQQEGHKVDFDENDKIFDQSKIADHGAIVPTISFPDLDKLSEDERLEYNVIKNRFMAHFCSEDRIVEDTEITVAVGTEEMTIKGHVVKSEGWFQFENGPSSDVMLPNLKIGDIIPTNFKVTMHETTPKKHYTVESLNNYLENPLKSVKSDNDDEKYKQMLEGCSIGTAASTAGIIKKVCKDDLIQLKGKTYKILPKGKFLIETIDTLGINIDVNTTIEMNKRLKKVSSGEEKVDDYIKIVQANISKLLKASNDKEIKEFDNTVIVGKCPRCKENVIESSKTFHCVNSNCKFVLFKDDLFWTSKHKHLSATMAKTLLSKKELKLKKLYSQSKDKEYEAAVIMEDDGFNTKFKLKF